MMRTFADECAAAIRQELFYANMHLNSATAWLGENRGVPIGKQGLSDIRQSLRSLEHVKQKLTAILDASEPEQSRAA